MALNLSEFTKGIEIAPPKLLIYGVDGVGKSSFASEFPDCVILRMEDRHKHISKATKSPVITDLDVFMEALQQLAEQEHDFKNVVVDTTDWLEMLVKAKLCKKYNVESIASSSNNKGSPFAYGKDKVMIEEYFMEIIRALDYLYNTRKMGIILVAHADVSRYDDPMRDSYDRYVPANCERVRELLNQWVDCIFFANYKTIVKKEDAGFNQTETKALGNGKRIMYTEERPSFKAKNSFGIPAEIDFSYEVYKKHIDAWVKAHS